MRVLRAAFFLLLLGNLLLFAWGYFGPAGSGGEADRLANQLAPDKVRIVAKGAQPKAVEPQPEACRALGALPREQAQRLVELLRGRDAGLKLAQRAVEEPTSWWVYLPPQPDKEQADQKAAELKKLGLGDLFVVQDSGPNRFAVSLGLYKSEQGAKERLDTLQKKGVGSARIEARLSSADKVVVEVRGLPGSLAKALEGLPADFAPAISAECAPGK